MKDNRYRKVALAGLLFLAGAGAVGTISTNHVDAASYPLFADVSSYQPSTYSFYQALKNAGVSGVAVKLTEGTYYINNSPSDPNHAKNQISAAQSLGMKVSAYHFAHYTNNQEAINEANYFADQADRLGLPQSTVMIADIEDNNMRASVKTTTLAFENQLAERGYSNQATYASASWFNAGLLPRNYPIWVASYGVSQPGVDNAAAWQYTSTYKVAGTMVDMSYDFNGLFTDGSSSQAPSGVTNPTTISSKKSVNLKKQVISGASLYYLESAGFNKFSTNAKTTTESISQQATDASGNVWDLISRNGQGYAWVKDSDTTAVVDPSLKKVMPPANATVYYLLNTGFSAFGKASQLSGTLYALRTNGEYTLLTRDGTTGLAWIKTADLNGSSSSTSNSEVDFSAVGQVNYPHYSIAVWSKPGQSLIANKYLKDGTRWKIFKKVTLSNGKTWYNVGGNQWLDGQYLKVTAN